MSYIDYCIRCPRCGACLVANTDGTVYCPRCGWVGRIRFEVAKVEYIGEYWEEEE